MTIAEIISIGDELTSGQRLDTNTQWFSQRLGELGIRAMYHTTVADDLDANTAVFRAAVNRADVVITSGGLGPTADDLTREVMATLLGVELVLDPASLEHIQRLFRRRHRPMPERNIVQAMFPAGSQAIHNPHGSAPGIAAEVPRSAGGTCRVYCLPGVPAELKEMWPSVVSSLSSAGLVRQIIRHRQIKCFGVGESDLEQMLPDLIRRGRVPSVGITVSQATITLRITAAGESEARCETAIEPTAAIIYQCLGQLVFGEAEDELQHAVARLLRGSGRTLATAEWGTAGQIAHWLRQAPESDGHYLGGLVLPDALAAHTVLDIPTARIDGDDARPWIGLAAEATRAKLGTDYALAVSPLPAIPPSGDEVPLIHFALAGPHGAEIHSASYAGHPDILQQRAAKQALNLLRLELLKQASNTIEP